MLLAGDEFGRTQGGNNNAYCQDNELSWMDWPSIQSSDPGELYRHIQTMADLRKRWKELRCERFIHGFHYDNYDNNAGLDEIQWYHPNGELMRPSNWQDSGLKSLGLLLNGDEIFPDEKNDQQLILIYFNASKEDVPAILPAIPKPGNWTFVLGTSTGCSKQQQEYPIHREIQLEAQSISIMQYQESIQA
jgi:glycogen operon protein